MLSGIFTGYVQQSGGFWNGDVILAEWDNVNSAESVSDIYPRRVSHKELTVIKVNGKHKFPLAEGALNQPH